MRLRLCPATFLGGVQELILWLHLLLLLVLSVVLLVTLLLLLLLLLYVRCAFMGGLLLLLLLCCTPKGCHKWMPRELHQLLSCLVLLLPHMHPPKGPCLFQHIYARCGTASEVRCKRDVLLLLLCSHLP